MKLRSLAVLMTLALGLASCQQPPPTQPDIFISNQNTNNNGQGGPTASPSPGAGGELPPGSRIAILMFGQTCPSGVTVPRNGSRECKLSCSCDFTCTPKDSAGNDLPESIHGPTAVWAVLSGSERVQISRDNFNLGVRPLLAGPFTLSCTVKNLTGVVDAAVVAASSSSTGASAMAGNPDPSFPPPHAPAGFPFPKPTPSAAPVGERIHW